MNLDGKLIVITGGSGFLGKSFIDAISKAGGKCIILDIVAPSTKTDFIETDITIGTEVLLAKDKIYRMYGKNPDILINNATIDPKDGTDDHFEEFNEAQWDLELKVGLKGAMLCSKIFGTEMAKKGSGVILNISSDLGLIGPDQRIYGDKVKPVTYSVIKHGLIGLTRYLATYWADKGVRVNAVCFGGVYNNQPKEFVDKLTNLIPMGRMAKQGEYGDTIVFLISNSSSYMTGSVITMDGGRTCW